MFGWSRTAQYITPIGLFYKNCGFYLGLSDCDELVGVVDVFYYEFVILLNLFDVPVVLQIQVIPF